MKLNKAEIARIFTKSFKDAWKWSFWKWLTTAGIGILIALIQVGVEVWDNLTYSTAGIYALASITALYLLRLILLLLINALKYFHEVYKNSSYGDAIILLNDCFSEAHYYRKTQGFQKEEFMISMMLFCENLKEIFDNITKSKCSVSIKIPVNNDQVDSGTVLKNLTRNKAARKRDTVDYESIPHTIIGNTAFTNCLNNVITGKKKKYYINNQVNKDENYNNTSKSCYDEEKLPYNSELVYPLIPIRSKGNENFDCHGFICVDSTNENAFSGKYDAAILEGVADGIYDIIVEMNKANTNEV